MPVSCISVGDNDLLLIITYFPDIFRMFCLIRVIQQVKENVTFIVYSVPLTTQPILTLMQSVNREEHFQLSMRIHLHMNFFSTRTDCFHCISSLVCLFLTESTPVEVHFNYKESTISGHKHRK